MMKSCYEVIFLIRVLGMHVKTNNGVIAENMYNVSILINSRF